MRHAHGGSADLFPSSMCHTLNFLCRRVRNSIFGALIYAVLADGSHESSRINRHLKDQPGMGTALRHVPFLPTSRRILNL
jgi:hypothetical protein